MRPTACPSPYSGPWVDHLTRWRRLLETGVYATVEEIATADKSNASYESRVLRLTLLVPDIVEAILDGRQRAEMTLAAVMRPSEVVWGEQPSFFCCCAWLLRKGLRQLSMTLRKVCAWLALSKPAAVSA